MAHPALSVESMAPGLGRGLASVIACSALHELLRKNLQVQQLRGAVGLPRRSNAHTAERWLAGPHVLLRLTDSRRFDALACDLALPADQAAALVDRVLGGAGSVGIASAAGLATPAECGVLAYFAARCVRAFAPHLQVRDVVSHTAAELRADADGGVLWPVRIALDDALQLDVKVIYRDRSACPPGVLAARLALSDVLEEMPPSFAPGDLLVSDSWSLHVTSGGLAGLLTLCVDGSDERIAVTLTGEKLALAQVPVAAHAARAADLVVRELALDFWQLAGLGGGEVLHVPSSEGLGARLVFGQRSVRGQLVRFRGRLALRVDEPFSPD